MGAAFPGDQFRGTGGATEFPPEVEIAGLSVAGQRTNDSAYLLDGVINTDPDYNALSYVPVVDAIAEFQVQVAPDSEFVHAGSTGVLRNRGRSSGYHRAE